MADSISSLKCSISSLKEELEKSENTLENLDNENTKLLSENEIMRKCIKELERDNSNMKHEIAQKDEAIAKQSTELQNLKQLFIDKTI